MSKLTQELVDSINSYMDEGYSQRAACNVVGIPESTWRTWRDRGKLKELKNKNKGGSMHGKHSNLEKKKEVKAQIHHKDTIEDNSRVLLISDLHIPYHHPDAIAFLKHLKKKYNPTRVIGLGDELDQHALSFHDNDPDLPSAGDELSQSLPVLKQLFKLFPKMDLLESNHGSMVYRKANHHGIPRSYLRTYNEVLGVDEGWKWWHDMTITLPNGNRCYLHHGKSANITKTSQTMGMCSVAGHYHETFKVEYWANPNGLYWAMQSACLIDDSVYAFNYNNCNLKRPIIGTTLIIDSLPVLEPMVLDTDGRWVGR